jgi:hypothetical protein
MIRRACVLAAALLVAIGAPATVSAQSVDGNWKFIYVVNFNNEQTLAIIGLKTDDGKMTGDVVGGRLANPKIKSVTKEGNLLRVVMQGSGVELVFEGIVPKDATKQLTGSVSIDGTVYPGSLVATEDTEFDAKKSFRILPAPALQQARTLTAKVAQMKQKAVTEKDPEKKTDLLKKYEEALAEANDKVPKLYREVIEKHADSPVIFDAGMTLIRTAKNYDPKAIDVKALAKSMSSAAKAYGPRWQAEIGVQLASALVAQDGHAALALDYAKEAEKGLTEKSSPAQQIRVLNIVSQALRKNGKAEEADKIELRVAKIDENLDREYLTTMPGFKGEAFGGRKGKSERAVFMELFTGATCPPCVAADLAFDVLQKTYKPSELVLIQYHMHIPGPDPLTNADTEARWAYYRGKVTGVPSSMFNGKPKAGGGGGVANAEKKYEAYRGVIEPLLEEDASVKLTAKAERHGDKIDIHVKVSGLSDPGPEKKLRILLAEETVRYPGSNKIRLHHNVVRAFPGGTEGKALTEAASKHNASINVGELRGQLTKYLDAFEAGGRSFANPSRPMAMNHLRVIAFVQDDSNQEILQAVQVEVEGK